MHIVGVPTLFLPPMGEAERIRQLLGQASNVVITTHQRPDGDAMGSTLGLFHVLQSLGHRCAVILPTEVAAYLHWLPGCNQVIVFPRQRAEAEHQLQQAQVVFCLDFNQWDRLGELGTCVAALPVPKVLMDHHLEKGKSVFDVSFADEAATSSSEMVLRWIKAAGLMSFVDARSATCLYTGIVADTDRFRIPATGAEVHRLVAELLDKGVDHVQVYSKMFENFSRRRLKLFAFCLAHRLWLPEDLPVGIIALEPEDLLAFEVQPGDTEGLVNYPMLIQEVVVSALITPDGNGSKLSLRSKGSFSVEQICRQFFHGGGHRNAAGGSSTLTVSQVAEQLISIFATLKKDMSAA